VDRLVDLVVRDKGPGRCFQLRNLIKAHLKKVKADKNTTAEIHLQCKDIIMKLDGMTKEEIGTVLRRFEMKGPISGSDLSVPFETNLMFSTAFCKTGYVPSHLSPDLARGIFANFKRLLEFNEVILQPPKS
jgi:glycyl-tRNA synthetase